MSAIFIIFFLILFWAFLRFWSKMLHEFDLVLDSVADKTVKIYSDKNFCCFTWEQWHTQIKLMKIFGIMFFIISSIATIVAITMSMIVEIQNGMIPIILFVGIICLMTSIKYISFVSRCLCIFYEVYFFGIDYVSENNEKIKNGCELEKKCLDFIKRLDIEKPYPSNKMLMTYEFRKLNYNWDIIFTGKHDTLVGYYIVLSITILFVCISIISMGVIALLMMVHFI